MDPSGSNKPGSDAEAKSASAARDVKATDTAVLPKTVAKVPQALAGGRYELAEFVSKGGMGAVYRAHDVDLDRWVAVKCLLDVSKAGSRALAVKEARTLASLSHPNIMRVFDILQSGDQVWIVSEWLEGKSLAQMPLPLPPPAVAAIMAQIYEALASAHAAQVIHRDIKPSNIMISPDGRVSLIDFGVAFAPGESTGDTLAGSLRYTDPRILEGEPPDAASDLFSAALLQVELMCGETVLPEMAPLPLYRHIKKNLRSRLDELLDGNYPPLVELVRSSIGRAAKGAKEASSASHAMLRKFTGLTPERYLSGTLCAGKIADSDAERILQHEIDDALRDPSLSPRQKAPWLAFREQRGNQATAHTAPTLHRPTHHSRRGRRQERHLQGRRLAWTVVLVGLIALVGGIAGKRRFSGAHTTPTVAAVAVEELPLPSSSTASSANDRSTDLATPPRPEGASTLDTVASTPAPAAPKPVEIQIVADAWAVVIVDEREIGRLPQAAPFSVAPGQHTLRLENPSVEPMATALIVTEGNPQKLHFKLKPKVATRTFKLGTPGHLFIDGVDHGQINSKNLNMSVTLTFGTHDVAVKRGTRIIKRKSIALGPDSPKDIVLE